MGLRLSTMLAATAECDVAFDGEQIRVCYRPNAVTLELTDRIDAEGKAADEAEERGEQTEHDWITAQLLPVVEWWDVLEDDDSRMEPTRPNMRRMPLKFLQAVLTAVIDDQKVAPGENEGSADG